MTTTRSRLLRQLRNAGLDAAYLIVGLPLGIVTFTIAVTGLSLAAGLAITLLGIPILLATLIVCRWFAVLERHRAAPLLGAPIAAPERELTGSLWQRTKTVVADGASWLDLLWSLLLLAFGTIGFSIAVSVWSVVLSFVTSPLWMWTLSDIDDPAAIPALLNDPSAGYAALRVAIGLALVPVAYWTCRGLALGTAHTARALLGRIPREEAPTTTMPLPA
jgi:Putative sensor